LAAVKGIGAGKARKQFFLSYDAGVGRFLGHHSPAGVVSGAPKAAIQDKKLIPASGHDTQSPQGLQDNA
jgi:hypothetical protein